MGTGPLTLVWLLLGRRVGRRHGATDGRAGRDRGGAVVPRMRRSHHGARPVLRWVLSGSSVVWRRIGLFPGVHLGIR